MNQFKLVEKDSSWVNANGHFGTVTQHSIEKVSVAGTDVENKEDDLSEADILKFCDGKLARFKLPRGVAFVDVIPRNPRGKVLKRLLREDFPGPASV